MRVNVENPAVTNDEINFYNNIWSDPTGTMGASFGGGNDFSDSPAGEVSDWRLANNQYFNGGLVVPADAAETINYTDDSSRILADPGLAPQNGLIPPRWNEATSQFADGSPTIHEALVNLVMHYGAPASGSGGVDRAMAAQAPVVDILGKTRGATPDIGAFEISAAPGDFDFDGDVDGRDFLIWQRGETRTPYGAGDLADWQATFGTHAGDLAVSTIAVPEPMLGLLAMLVASGIGVLKCRAIY